MLLMGKIRIQTCDSSSTDHYGRWNADAMNGDCRRSPRYAFVATVEVTHGESTSVIAARLGDLSLHGCFINMINPLPAGALIMVRISAGYSVFRARGRVVYSQPNLGVGVEFQDIEARYQTVLKEWLLDAKDINKTQKLA